MKTKTMIGAISLMLLAMSMNAGAYHITGVPTALGTSATTWDNPANVGPMVEADAGLAEARIKLCESDGPFDPVNDAPESHHGIGGLCYADGGYATPGGFPPSATDEPPTSTWGEVMPTGGTSGVGTWFARVGSNAHGCTGIFGPGDGSGAADEFFYLEVLAFWSTNGHVTFFVKEVGTSGSYGGGSPGTGGQTCNAAGTVGVR